MKIYRDIRVILAVVMFVLVLVPAYANADICSVSYIIYISGTTIYAKNGSTGNIDYSGTDAATVIQNAINNLGTGGGLVAIKKGTYTFTNTVTIPSKVAIVGEGTATKITIQNNFGQNYASIFKSQSLSSDISIKDIWIDGNKANQIYLNIRSISFDTGTEGIKVTGVKITNSKGAGIISGGGCKRIIVESCDIDGVDGDAGIWISGASGNVAYDVVIKGNIIKSSNRGIVAVYAQDVMIIGNRCVSWANNDCILIDQSSEEIVIEGNVCRDGGEGIKINNYLGAAKKVNVNGNIVINMSSGGISVAGGCDDILIEGNYVYLTTGDGIGVNSTAKNCTVDGNLVIDTNTGIAMVSPSASAIITNNICTLNDKSGINFNAPKGMVTNNICYNNNVAQNADPQHQNGISITNCLDALVTGNSCYDDRVTKLQEYGIRMYGTSSSGYLFENFCVGNKTGSISLTGSNNVVKDNIGYKTENGGVANVSNGGTIAHGLVITPTSVQLTPRTTTPYRVSYTANGTNITVYHNAGGPIDVAWYAEIQ